MIKTVLYIAASLDGYIARPDGKIDWLTSVPYPQNGDYGYTELLGKTGTIIMGRKTYDDLIGFKIEWPYKGIDTYIITTNKELEILSPETFVLHSNIHDFIQRLKLTATKDIWLVGGGQIITKFINEGLLDKMIITIIPKIIGEGIPLFAPIAKETSWKLIDTISYDTGVVSLIYEKQMD